MVTDANVTGVDHKQGLIHGGSGMCAAYPKSGEEILRFCAGRGSQGKPTYNRRRNIHVALLSGLLWILQKAHDYFGYVPTAQERDFKNHQNDPNT